MRTPPIHGRASTVVVAGGFDLSLINFRGSLLKSLVEAGYRVVAVAPPQTAGVPGRLAAMGVEFKPLYLARTGLNPWADVRVRREFKRLLVAEKADLFLAYTIKPVVHGIGAAARSRVPKRVALITGLGAAFNTPGVKGRLIEWMACILYRQALRSATRVIVQNNDIGRFLLRRRLLSDARKIVMVPGSGVDTTHFVAQTRLDGPPVFLLLARMIKDKGILEFVEAARQMRVILPQARFLLLGDSDPNPAAIAMSEIRRWQSEGVVEYHAGVHDVRPWLQECSVFVLPSYHEGMPRSVLEAMASSRPVITTDTIGCRETIENVGLADAEGVRTGDNGLLVPVRCVAPLVSAMLRLAVNPRMAEAMGRSGRELAEKRFDVRGINRLMITAMDLPYIPPPLFT